MGIDFFVLIQILLSHTAEKKINSVAGNYYILFQN